MCSIDFRNGFCEEISKLCGGPHIHGVQYVGPSGGFVARTWHHEVGEVAGYVEMNDTGLSGSG